jgi:hypothetical protein
MTISSAPISACDEYHQEYPAYRLYYPDQRKPALKNNECKVGLSIWKSAIALREKGK